jgi:hypothetical protein
MLMGENKDASIFLKGLNLKRQDFENYNKLFSPSIACAKHAGTVTKT